MSLTAKQKELLTFIDEYIKKHGGVAPTYDEMAEACGLASKSGVLRMIRALEERGYIRRIEHRARAIEVLRLPRAQDSGDPEQIVGCIMSMMERGAVTLRLHAPHESRDPTERTDVPFVSVTAGGKTWAQPIRRSLGKASSPHDVAEALGLAVGHFITGA